MRGAQILAEYIVTDKDPNEQTRRNSAEIREAFGANDYPGGAFLQGSPEGCEPYEEVGPFQGRTNWEALEASFLDEHASALSFFSEAGLRFFFPAYLRVDVRGELKFAKPVNTLTQGFSEVEIKVTMHGRDIVVRSGKSELLNPRRYGAATFHDHARYRFSIFTWEEAGGNCCLPGVQEGCRSPAARMRPGLTQLWTATGERGRKTRLQRKI